MLTCGQNLHLALYQIVCQQIKMGLGGCNKITSTYNVPNFVLAVSFLNLQIISNAWSAIPLLGMAGYEFLIESPGYVYNEYIYLANLRKWHSGSICKVALELSTFNLNVSPFP